MDNVIQIEKLRYARMCGEKALFHDLINHYLEKSENLKPEGSPRALKQPLKVFLNVAVRKIPLETSAVDFCFCYREYNFLSTENELCSMS